MTELIIGQRASGTLKKKAVIFFVSSLRTKARTRTADTLLRDNRMYVACQTSDDFSYVVEYAGEDHLIVGTDYGHADYSNDIEAIQTLASGGKISPSLAHKILGDNPRRLYGL